MVFGSSEFRNANRCST